jgi:hypothetical protein
MLMLCCHYAAFRRRWCCYFHWLLIFTLSIFDAAFIALSLLRHYFRHFIIRYFHAFHYAPWYYYWFSAFGHFISLISFRWWLPLRHYISIYYFAAFRYFHFIIDTLIIISFRYLLRLLFQLSFCWDYYAIIAIISLLPLRWLRFSLLLFHFHFDISAVTAWYYCFSLSLIRHFHYFDPEDTLQTAITPGWQDRLP